jgi:hypothetical protein
MWVSEDSNSLADNLIIFPFSFAVSFMAMKQASSAIMPPSALQNF